MLDNLPVIIKDWIGNMNNKNNSEAVRFNYFQMLNNVVQEVGKETRKFESSYAMQTTKMVKKTR